jgi:hypothetical protein
MHYFWSSRIDPGAPAAAVLAVDRGLNDASGLPSKPGQQRLGGSDDSWRRLDALP